MIPNVGFTSSLVHFHVIIRRVLKRHSTRQVKSQYPVLSIKKWLPDRTIKFGHASFFGYAECEIASGRCLNSCSPQKMHLT